MLADVKQNELDIAEEKLLTLLFGSAQLNDKAQWLLRFFNIDINQHIQNFENFVKPIMLDNGMVDAGLARSLVVSKAPTLANIVPQNNFRLVDIVDGVAFILKGVKR